ncbi:uncharacterized protein LOC133197594 [Saccostrea echinata]|uniref:uncharacterized protein LOC133197594 n=1 Tax=Saccostrea echinata TaxID=191078 RepID=UPI002A7F3F84|nr:uncharacterized protein LOC133197594 [Saccostrea echinata]
MEDCPICPHLSKLTHFYRGVYPKALRRLMHLEIVNKSAGSFVEFLNDKKETLFHLKGKQCCCGYRRRNSVLKETEWNNLYTTQNNSCPNNYTDCFHVYKAREWLTVDHLDFSLACVLLRNICPGQYENTIKTAQKHRNEVIHLEKSSVGGEEFELLWNKALTSLSDIADLVSKEFKEQIILEAELVYKYKPEFSRYLENTLCEIEEHEKDDSFTPTKVTQSIIHSLDQHGIVIIVGYPGSGKSSLGLEVIRQMYSNDKTVIKLNHVHDWSKLINPKSGHVVFIDDFLGASSTTLAGILEVKPLFSTIFACVKNSNTKVVLTIRKSIYERWHDHLEESRLFKSENVIDLAAEENCLTLEEKKAMLRNHFQSKGISVMRTKKETQECHEPSIDQFTVDAIAHTSAFYFPLLCFLFTKSEKHLHLGLRFFEQPRKTLVTEIDSFRKSTESKERWKYAVLSYTAVSGNVINPKKLNTDCITMISESLDLTLRSSSEFKRVVADAAEELKNDYLRLTSRDTYEFIHHTFLEATILSCGLVFPKLVIEQCNNDTLFELIRTESYVEREGEVVLRLDLDCFETLAKRFISEITSDSKIIPHVLFHPVMEDTEFSEQFFSQLESSILNEDLLPSDVYLILIEASKWGHLRTVKALFSSNIPRHVVEEAVNYASYNNHASIVELLVKDLKPDPYFLQACSFGCDDVVSLLLEKGFVQELELVKEGIFRSSKAGHSKITNVLINVYKISTGAFEFKKTIMKILYDAIEAEKTNTVMDIISCQELCINMEDLIGLVLESCYSNQLEFAKYLLQKYCHLHIDDGTLLRLFKGSRRCVDLVFEMEDIFCLQDYFGDENIKIILFSANQGRYIIEKAFVHFPQKVERSLHSSPILLLHFLWIGCHSVVSQVLQGNIDLLRNVQKFEKVAEKYSIGEFAAFCGFPGFDLFATNGSREKLDLLSCCVEGFRAEGRLPDLEYHLGYRKNVPFDMIKESINYFETDSRQHGYFLCLQSLYDETSKLNTGSPIFATIMEIMHDQFESETLSFLKNEVSSLSLHLLTVSSMKMEVLKMFRTILLQHLDFVKLEEMCPVNHSME